MASRRAMLDWLRRTQPIEELRKSEAIDPTVIKSLQPDKGMVPDLSLHEQVSVGLITLCADLRGYTALSARVAVGDLVALTDVYVTAMARDIERHGGVIEKYPGDGVMAHFAYTPRGAESAISAAQLIRTTVQMAVNPVLQAHGKPCLSCSVALDGGKDCGLLSCGTEAHPEIIAIGNSVNVAAKLEKYTPEDSIYLGAYVFELLGPLLQDRCVLSACRRIRLVPGGGTYPIYEFTDPD
jgi:class 3 adenylate cyclase